MLPLCTVSHLQTLDPIVYYIEGLRSSEQFQAAVITVAMPLV